MNPSPLGVASYKPPAIARQSSDDFGIDGVAALGSRCAGGATEPSGFCQAETPISIESIWAATRSPIPPDTRAPLVSGFPDDRRGASLCRELGYMWGVSRLMWGVLRLTPV